MLQGAGRLLIFIDGDVRRGNHNCFFKTFLAPRSASPALPTSTKRDRPDNSNRTSSTDYQYNRAISLPSTSFLPGPSTAIQTHISADSVFNPPNGIVTVETLDDSLASTSSLPVPSRSILDGGTARSSPENRRQRDKINREKYTFLHSG